MCWVGRDSCGPIKVQEVGSGSRDFWGAGSAEGPPELNVGVCGADSTTERSKGVNFRCLCQGARWVGSEEAPSPVAGGVSSAAGS